MIDDLVHAWFLGHRHPMATQLMLLADRLHSTWGLLLASAAFGVLLWRRGQRSWLFALACSVPGAMLLNVAVKHLVGRPRPAAGGEPLLALTTYSFPSGHAAGATAFYAFGAAWLLSRHAGSRTRMAILATAAALVAWVDLSRVYLGVHYLSDVLAGSVLGLAWVFACLRWIARPAAAGPGAH